MLRLSSREYLKCNILYSLRMRRLEPMVDQLRKMMDLVIIPTPFLF
jgi:hypothetical protein